jgi:hypothetical protein
MRERDAGWTYDMTTAEAAAAFPERRSSWVGLTDCRTVVLE